MRKWKPCHIPDSEVWAVVHQVLDSKMYRPEIVRTAHEIHLGGHLRINKTCDKIIIFIGLAIGDMCPNIAERVICVR